MSLYVQEAGPEGAQTIVFLHADDVSGWMWGPQVETLQKEYHCLVPDLPEHGRSRDIKPYRIQDAAKLVADLIREKAHGGKAHVIGLSIGAQIALQLVSETPELIDHLVLSGVSVHPPVSKGFSNMMFKLFTPTRNVRFLVGMHMINRGIPGRYYMEVRADKREIPPESVARVLEESWSFRLPAGLEKVNTPTLVIYGEYEKPEIRQSAHDVSKALPNAKGQIVPKVTQCWNLDEPNLFTWTIRDWINDEPLPDELKPLK